MKILFLKNKLVFFFSELMNELVTFAERVPKLVNGTAWKRPEIRRYCTEQFAPLKTLLHDTIFPYDCHSVNYVAKHCLRSNE